MTLELSPEKEELLLQIQTHESIVDLLQERIDQCLKAEQHKKAFWNDFDKYKNNRNVRLLSEVSENFAARYNCMTILHAQIDTLRSAIESSVEGRKIERWLEDVLHQLTSKLRLLQCMTEELVSTYARGYVRHRFVFITFVKTQENEVFRLYCGDNF
jgi:hypothetical protein